MSLKKIADYWNFHIFEVRIILAISFAILLFILIFFVGFNLVLDYNELDKEFTEPRSFEVPLRINLDGTRSFDVDVEFSLNFTYHNGTLIVDEPININSRAVFITKNAENIKTIHLGFQNCLLYNKHSNSIVPDEWGIPANAYLFFNSSQSGIFYPYVWTEEMSVMWTIDGSYHPIVAITYKDQTEPSVMLIDDVTITVYPREQLSQIQTNKVNTELSIAVFFLSMLNLATIFSNILPKKPKTNSEEFPQEKKENQQTQERPLTPETTPTKKDGD